MKSALAIFHSKVAPYLMCSIFETRFAIKQNEGESIWGISFPYKSLLFPSAGNRTALRFESRVGAFKKPDLLGSWCTDKAGTVIAHIAPAIYIGSLFPSGYNHTLDGLQMTSTLALFGWAKGQYFASNGGQLDTLGISQMGPDGRQ